MLSKVLSARDAQRAQPIVFAPVTGSQLAPASQTRSREPDTTADQERTALLNRVRQLEGDLSAARREGFEAGLQQGRAEIAPVIERMNASVAEITGMRQDLRRRAEKDVVQLSLLIARRVLHRELNVDQDALTALARMAFDRLSRAETCRIVVHPQFAPAITAALPQSQAGRIRVDPDPNCASGTLVIHSDAGVIDASVDAQLEEIGRGLTDRLINS